MIIVAQTLSIHLLVRCKLLRLGHEKLMINSLLKLILETGIHTQTSGSRIRMALSLSPKLWLGPLGKRHILEVSLSWNGLLRTRLLFLLFLLINTIILFFYLISIIGVDIVSIILRVILFL